MAVISLFVNLHQNCNHMNWAESDKEHFGADQISI